MRLTFMNREADSADSSLEGQAVHSLVDIEGRAKVSALSNPPGKAPYAGPISLWPIGFFILMSSDACGKLSAPMAVLSVAYVFFPGYLLAVLSYNLTIRRKKLSAWRHKFLCMHCGNTITHHH